MVRKTLGPSYVAVQRILRPNSEPFKELQNRRGRDKSNFKVISSANINQERLTQKHLDTF